MATAIVTNNPTENFPMVQQSQSYNQIQKLERTHTPTFNEAPLTKPTKVESTQNPQTNETQFIQWNIIEARKETLTHYDVSD